jgi:AcrR family transcriptional regulator
MTDNPRRGRPRDPSIDRAIVDACVELLEEVGRHRLSREQIARRAGVSLPAVNRRYADVDAILEAIASTPMHAEPLPEAASRREHLVAGFTRAARTMAAQPIRRSAAELLAAAAGNARIDAALSASLRELREPALRLVAAGIARGELRPDCDGELVLDLLNGALYYRLLWHDRPLVEAEVEPLVDGVLAGFAL